MRAIFVNRQSITCVCVAEHVFRPPTGCILAGAETGAPLHLFKILREITADDRAASFSIWKQPLDQCRLHENEPIFAGLAGGA
jgi:hypothetical protein